MFSSLFLLYSYCCLVIITQAVIIIIITWKKKNKGGEMTIWHECAFNYDLSFQFYFLFFSFFFPWTLYLVQLYFLVYWMFCFVSKLRTWKKTTLPVSFWIEEEKVLVFLSVWIGHILSLMQDWIENNVKVY